MPTRNVVLTDYQARLVERLVASGRYQNASEVLRDGLRMVESREEEGRARLKALRKAVQIGIDDMEADRFTEYPSVGKLKSSLSTRARAAIKRAANKDS